MQRIFRIVLVQAGLALAALALAAAPTGALAQSFLGQWNCQMTYTEFSGPNNRSSGFSREFAIIFYGNGSYQAAGTQAAADGYTQFESQGQWQEEKGVGLIARGPERTNSPYDFGGGQFVFVARFQPDGTLATSYEQMDPNQQYVMTRTLIYCEHVGG